MNRARIAKAAAIVAANQAAFDAAIEAEQAAEVAILTEAIDLARPALPFLGSQQPFGRALKVDAGIWIDATGALLALTEDSPDRPVPITPLDALDRRDSLATILEALATACERSARGKLPQRTQEALQRTETLRAILALLRAHKPALTGRTTPEPF